MPSILDGMNNSRLNISLHRYSIAGFLCILFFVFMFSPVYANENENIRDYIVNADTLKELSIKIGFIAGLLLALLILITLIKKEKTEFFKKLIFFLIVITTLVPTIYFISATIYANITSETKGPVHWHADFRIFACDEELLPPKAKGLSNKVGTSLFHEHEDRRIHVEGVVASRQNILLHDFFEAQGGFLENDFFSVPVDSGIKEFRNGDLCPSGEVGEWSVFLYKVHDNIAVQTKLLSYTNYVISPHVNVPPGDCIIFEFGSPKDRSDRICDFYKIESQKGKLEIR